MKGQILDYLDPFGDIIASIAWTARASYNSATEATPVQLIFWRDMMLFNLTTLTEWKALSMQKQK